MSDRTFLSPVGDVEMDAASQQARNSFKIFWRELSWEMRRIIPGLDISAVKHAFPTNNELKSAPSIEQMWVGDLDFDGRYITGSLLNRSQHISGLNCGDTVTFDRDGISDWMYAIGGKVYGAFTVNLLRQRMTTPDRQSHDASWGLDFGAPERVFIAPDYSFNHFANRSTTETPEHPMSVNMASSSEVGIQQMGDRINDPSFCGMTMLQFESLAGNLTQVELLLKYGADKNIRNTHGQTALDLARIFNWTKISDFLVNHN